MVDVPSIMDWSLTAAALTVSTHNIRARWPHHRISYMKPLGLSYSCDSPRDGSLKEIWPRNTTGHAIGPSASLLYHNISTSSEVQAAQSILRFFLSTFTKFSNGKTGFWHCLHWSRTSGEKEHSRNPRHHLGWLARWRKWQHWKNILTPYSPHVNLGAEQEVLIP